MKNTAFLFIDFQQAFADPSWGKRNNPFAEKNAYELLKQARMVGQTIIHVKHISTNNESLFYEHSPTSKFIDGLEPEKSEMVFTKSVNSAFIGTKLEEYLRGKKIEALITLGLTTDHCVSTTVRMGSNLGFQMILVSDATATFERKGIDGSTLSAELIHDVHLSSLNREFATILSTQETLKLLQK
ncbi:MULTISPECIES: cysteine hydrolase family protein [Bacillus]|uniref:Isochorismatase-like domain-containing protein n=2 Tax=Bacillus TaxID=1386 RepID=A0A0M4FUY5_9BACI|nr:MULTISPECIES: cysteine hydrolase family protein [Bacillus]ALC83771.1 hypothetical protein AM592_21305 [Bacillus gobiensis]MBP1083994.1 nicotinamidase-related amidase [Bacillus capparidis]MED1096960.1 cysteine hydrolase family protein [Bacillus capparidis]